MIRFTTIESTIHSIRTVFRATPESQKTALRISVVSTLLLPWFDLMLAFCLYMVLIVLQGESVTHFGIRFDKQSFGILITAFVVSAALRQLVDFGSVRGIRRLTQGVYRDFSMRLFRHYLELDWVSFIDEAKAVMAKHSTKTCLNAAWSFQIVLGYFASGVSLLVLGATTVYKFPRMAVVIGGVIGLSSWLTRKLVSSRVARAIKDHERYEKSHHQRVVESLNMPRELHVFGSAPAFTRHVEESLNELSRTKVLITVLPYLPRGTLDAVLTISLAVAIFVISKGHFQDAKTMIANFALLAMLARRMVPSISNFLYSFSQLQGAEERVRIVMRELERGSPLEAYFVRERAADGSLMKLQNIGYTYIGRGTLNEVLQDLSLEVCKGDRMVITGESGQGKSTLLMMMAGVLAPSQGSVRVAESVEIAFVPQEVALFTGSIMENIAFESAIVDERLAWEILEMVNLHETVHSLPHGIHTPIGDNGALFSGGQRQRIGIARALYRRPTILLLDEATSAVDEATEMKVMANIDRFMGDGAVVFVTHRTANARSNATRAIDLGAAVSAVGQGL